MHHIHFISCQISFHVSIDDTEAQAVFLFFWMEKSIDYFDLSKKTHTKNEIFEMSLSFIEYENA